MKVQNGIHPAVLDLIRTSFNVKREGGNVNLAVSTGAQEIISSRGSLFRFLQSSRLHSKGEGQQGVNSYGVLLPGQRPHVMPEYDINPGELFDIVTIDTETSGLVIGSETRSATLGRQTASVDELGNITYHSAKHPVKSTGTDGQSLWPVYTNRCDRQSTSDGRSTQARTCGALEATQGGSVISRGRASHRV